MPASRAGSGPGAAGTARALRFPVGSVGRPDRDFPGCSGTVRGGAVSPGDTVRIWPSGAEARVARIVAGDGEVARAATGDAVTLVLDRDVGAAPGDMIAAGDDTTLAVADQLQATLVWTGADALVPGRRYAVRIGTATADARVTNLKHRLDRETGSHEPARTLGPDDVGVVTLALDRALPFDSYKANRDTGSLALIDPYSSETVGTGTIEYALRRATNVVWHDTAVDKAVRAGLKGQKPVCVWFTGLSGSGKSTLANLVEQRLAAGHRHSYILDGDNVRHGLNQDLGFTETDRVENIRRMAEVARLMVDAGLIVLVCAISPYRRDREMARRLFAAGEFVEAFVDTPLAECERRDPKGLYAKARAGQIPNFTGVTAPYEAPEAADVHLDGARPAETLAEQIVAALDG